MDVLQNLRYSARTLRRSPMFAGVAILSLALGIGANTAIFSFVRAIVFEKLPAPGADRLVILRQHNEAFHMENCCFPTRFVEELRKVDADFEDVLAVDNIEVNFDDREQNEKLHAELISGNYFRMLGVHAAAGRLIGESDAAIEGSGAVCVISHRLWMERYGGALSAIGRRVMIDNQPYQIIGVSAPGFEGAALHEPHDLQIPASMGAKIFGNSEPVWMEVIARLRSGVSEAQAREHLNALGLRIERQVIGLNFTDRDVFSLEDGSQGLDSKKKQFGKPVLVLSLLIAMVLLITCANIAALLMVRAVERRREAGVRIALGASKIALVRRFFTESLLLAGIGGVFGCVAAVGFVRLLLAFLGRQGEGLTSYVRPDLTILGFSAVLTILCAVLFGILPAWRASQADPIQAIHGAGGRFSPRQSLLSRALIAGQVALSLALLFGAGLFVRTLHNLRAIDLGFQPENVALLHVDVSHTTHAGPNAGPFFDELRRRVNALPETRAASLSNISILSGAMMSIVLKIPGYAPPKGVMPTTYFTHISSGYFRTLGIPLLQGRDFTEADEGGGELNAIVNQRFAREFFAGDALGRSFQYGGGRTVHVVGIAGTTKFRSLREEPQPIMYLPIERARASEDLFLQVRVSGAAGSIANDVRGILRNLDPRMPVDQVTTMGIQIDRALTRERLLAFLSSLLGGLAVALAAIGLYGVLSFSVARRTREIGIRMAVGAPRRRILTIFLRESGIMIGAGVAAGIPLSFACGRLASSLLYDLPADDSFTVIGACVLLVLVGFAAVIAPAWRATRVDPIFALRHE